MSFAASLVESRCLMIASAASFWLPRGNIASSLPMLAGKKAEPDVLPNLFAQSLDE